MTLTSYFPFVCLQKRGYWEYWKVMSWESFGGIPPIKYAHLRKKTRNPFCHPATHSNPTTQLIPSFTNQWIELSVFPKRSTSIGKKTSGSIWETAVNRKKFTSENLLLWTVGPIFLGWLIWEFTHLVYGFIHWFWYESTLMALGWLDLSYGTWLLAFS